MTGDLFLDNEGYLCFQGITLRVVRHYDKDLISITPLRVMWPDTEGAWIVVRIDSCLDNIGGEQVVEGQLDIISQLADDLARRNLLDSFCFPSYSAARAAAPKVPLRFTRRGLNSYRVEAWASTPSGTASPSAQSTVTLEASETSLGMLEADLAEFRSAIATYVGS